MLCPYCKNEQTEVFKILHRRCKNLSLSSLPILRGSFQDARKASAMGGRGPEVAWNSPEPERLKKSSGLSSARELRSGIVQTGF